MSDLINFLVKIGVVLALVGQLPRATLFMKKEFIRVQQKGLGSLEEFTHSLQEGRPVREKF